MNTRAIPVPPRTDGRVTRQWKRRAEGLSRAAEAEISRAKTQREGLAQGSERRRDVAPNPPKAPPAPSNSERHATTSALDEEMARLLAQRAKARRLIDALASASRNAERRLSARTGTSGADAVAKDSVEKTLKIASSAFQSRTKQLEGLVVELETMVSRLEGKRVGVQENVVGILESETLATAAALRARVHASLSSTRNDIDVHMNAVEGAISAKLDQARQLQAALGSAERNVASELDACAHVAGGEALEKERQKLLALAASLQQAQKSKAAFITAHEKMKRIAPSPSGSVFPEMRPTSRSSSAATSSSLPRCPSAPLPPIVGTAI